MASFVVPAVCGVTPRLLAQHTGYTHTGNTSSQGTAWHCSLCGGRCRHARGCASRLLGPVAVAWCRQRLPDRPVRVIVVDEAILGILNEDLANVEDVRLRRLVGAAGRLPEAVLPYVPGTVPLGLMPSDGVRGASDLGPDEAFLLAVPCREVLDDLPLALDLLRAYNILQTRL